MLILRYAAVAALTFTTGMLSISDSGYTRITLTDISSNTEYYNGKLVEIDTYAHLDLVFDGDWTAGEPMDKPEVLTFLKLSKEPLQLREQLAVDISDSQYNRVRVLIRGRVRDNCAAQEGIMTCCFGRSITIEDATLAAETAEIERYSRPVF